MHPDNWWSTLKTFLFGFNSFLPPIRTDDGSVTYDPFLSDQEYNVPPTCFPKPKFTYFSFKLSEIKYYLKELNPYGGLDHHNIFPRF